MADHHDTYAALPAIQMNALRRYIEHGYLPGDFLTAVLTNDLKEAVARADAENQALLATYVQYLYNRAPYGCWGSPIQVAEWVLARRADRTPRRQEDFPC